MQGHKLFISLPFYDLAFHFIGRFSSLSQLFGPSAQRTLQTKNKSTMTFGTIVLIYGIKVTLNIFYASLPACLLYPYYKENLWLNSGVISQAMFARALKEIRNNDVFGYNFGHARWSIYCKNITSSNKFN